MKRLLLMRHARAARADGLPDHDRPLDERGRRDASAVGTLLRGEGLVPDRIYSSTAARALVTAERVAEGCRYAGEIRMRRQLYLADCQQLLRPLPELDATCESVLIVAHNPGMDELLRLLTGESRPLSPASLAHVHLPIERWDQVRPGVAGRLVDFWRGTEL